MPVIGHAQSFVADKVVAGSSLAGWTQLGGSRWAMQDGLVEDRSSTLADRWLLSPAALQDIALSGRFKCGPECDAGVLLRAEKTPAGGWRGVFVGLTTAGQGVFRAELDADGRFISKSPLPGAAPMIRIAPPPVANSGPPRAPGNRGSDSPTVSLPIRPTPKPFVPNEWNSFEVLLDANILRSAMNNQNGPSGTVDDNGDGFGAFGLYSNGAAPAAFADVAYKDPVFVRRVASRFRRGSRSSASIRSSTAGVSRRPTSIAMAWPTSSRVQTSTLVLTMLIDAN